MIKLNNISFQYDNLEILKDFNITFDENRITCLVGPSGVGKTTIANIVAQLIYPNRGKLTGIENCLYSYVFQEPRLLDWYSVYDNIDFVLKDIYDVQEREKISNKIIDIVELTDYKNYKPSALSGGMAQRVSIARAFSYPSTILIMDEPFKGLDIKLKYEMISSFQKLWQENKKTVLFITHDIEEAVSLSHTIYMIQNRPAEIIKKFEDVMNNDKALIKADLQERYLPSFI